MEAGHRARILIVDDNIRNIQLAASILRNDGYEILYSTSGAEAVDKAMAGDFDLILLDIMMPGEDGFDVCARLKASPQTSTVPVLFVTARADTDSIVRGFSVGASDYVSKPFHSAELRARVSSLVHLSITSRQQLQQAKALRELNHKLQSTNNELRDALSFKTKMLGIAAHDLKSPLGTLKSLIQLLEEGHQEHRPEILKDMHSTVHNMTALVSDVLDSAALELGKMQVNLQEVDLGDIVKGAAESLRGTAVEKMQHLTVSIAPETYIMGDERRLRQVFDNLISNAIKYSPRGGNVWVTVSGDASSAHVRVQDSGPGFSDEDQEKLFQLFQRLSARPTAGESSTGIGLAIVRQIVELHRGTVSLTETSHEGSTFEVSFRRIDLA